MPLPFNIDEAETVTFGGPGYGPFDLPKFGSITPAEELAIIPILKAWTEAEETDSTTMMLTWVELATIALKRLYPDQHSSQTQNLPRILVQELADFLLNERRGWEDIEEEGDEKKGQTGAATKSKRGKPSAKSIGESAPDGPTDSPQKNSAKPPST